MIIAKGQLQHHFWGDYYATIVLLFHSPVLAQAAVAKLPGFTPHHSEPKALRFHGTGPQLKLVESILGDYGADRRKVTSTRFSIDYGEPFEIALSLHPEAPQPEQLPLLP